MSSTVMEIAVKACRLLGSAGGIGPRDRTDIFDAGLFAKDGIQALDPLKAGTQHESMRSHVPCVDDGDDPADVSVIEMRPIHLSHGFGAPAGALRTRCHREADLGLLAVSRNADANIANQFVGRSIRDPKLDPGSARKKVHVAHILYEPRGLIVGLGIPVLELAHVRVTPVGLKAGEIGEFEPPQHDAAGPSRKRI